MQEVTQGRRLVGKKAVLARVPKSDRTLYNWEQRGWFPKRVVLPNGEVAWYEDEIDDWINNRRTDQVKARRPMDEPAPA